MDISWIFIIGIKNAHSCQMLMQCYVLYVADSSLEYELLSKSWSNPQVRWISILVYILLNLIHHALLLNIKGTINIKVDMGHSSYQCTTTISDIYQLTVWYGQLIISYMTASTKTILQLLIFTKQHNNIKGIAPIFIPF